METIHQRIKQLVDKFAGGKNTILAADLGVSEANIRSYIRGVLPKADILSKIVSCYDINADWLLTGRGSMLKTNSIPDCPDVLSEAVSMSKDTEKTQENSKKEEKINHFINKLLDRIAEQAEEIGRLKARIEELERRRGDTVSDAPTSTIAHAG